MARNIQTYSFLDMFSDATATVDDVTRVNPNVLISTPTINTYGSLEDRVVQVNTLSPAWVNLSIFSQIMPVFGGPIEIRSRVRISNITANTILNLSFGIDGAEVTGNRYGLVKVDSLDFVPFFEFSHIVTSVPAATHTFTLMGNIEPRTGTGSGLSATLTQGIAERMIITEVR